MRQQTRDFINTPLEVGGRIAAKRLVLAPMSALGNIAFRELLDWYGGFGLMFTGMCSAKAVPHENRRVSNVFCWRDEEVERLVCQILGSKPEQMAAAARRIEYEGFFGVDLNFGCSAARICKRSCGAALLRSPDEACRIVEAVRSSVSLPLFVKFRTGWKDEPDAAVELAKRFESAGADALTFHPRVAPDRRARPPRWSYIAKVKQAVDIPVFGNGNVFSASDCGEMLERTGCDGVAIGRAAAARPWIFGECAEGRRFGPEAYSEMFARFTELLEARYDKASALRLFRRAAVYISAFFRYGHEFNKRMQSAENFDEIRGIAEQFLSRSLELSERPNMNHF